MQNQTFQIEVSPEALDTLKKRAEKSGQSVDWWLQQGVDIISKVDDPVIRRLTNLSTQLEIPLWRVFENYIIDRWAYESAEKEVRGPVIMLTQFARDEKNELITGEQLFNMQKETYAKKLRYYSVAKAEKQDRDLNDHMRVLNQYLKPGERPGSVNVEELSRRKAKADFEASLSDLPPERQQSLKAARDKSEKLQAKHRQKERESKK